MNLSLRALAVAAMLSVSAVSGAAFAQDNPMVGGAAMYADKNIVENAVNSADHTTLVDAVQAAGLVETLSGEGPFTVLAPVNAAFDALPEGTVENLLKPENKDQLVAVLTYHVVPGRHPASKVAGMRDTATVNGADLDIATTGNLVTVQGARVVTADVNASNGVIHVIDKVLIPGS